MSVASGQFDGNLRLANGAIVDANINGSAEIARSKLALDSNKIYRINLTDLRVWDAFDRPLPGSGNVESSHNITFAYGELTPPTDLVGFVATRAYRVTSITVRPLVVGSDGGAVTGQVRKAPSATAIASGTVMHTGTADLKGTANTNQTLALSATSTDLDIASGDAIGLDVTGTTTAARGVVTVLLAPAGSSDDLRLVGGTFATASPTVQTSDSKNTSVTQYARFLVRVPAEYVAGETLTLRAHAGMNTTVASSSATIDFQVYKSDLEGSIGSDLCSTSATTINSLTDADCDFVIDGSSLVAGDFLDVRTTIAIVDSATGTAVIGQIGGIALLADVRG